MALESAGSGSGKRRRVDDPATEALPEDRISALPDDVRRRILTRLPLKDAIRSAALAHGWHDLWKSRWAEPTSCRDIRLLACDNVRKAIGSLESGPRHRLDRFSLVSDNDKLRQPHLKRLLAYATECRVEDLHVEVRRRLVFHLPRSSPLLAHLSLRNVNLCHMYYKGVQPLYALESMHLHSVSINVQFSNVMELCPRLRTLDMRGCSLVHMLRCDKEFAPLNLRRMTVADCSWSQGGQGFMPTPSLSSFRYSGSFHDLFFCLPKDAALTDLYLCFFDREAIPQIHRESFLSVLPMDLSGLSVLTISSNALGIASFMFIDQHQYWGGKGHYSSSFKELQQLQLMYDLQSLREIQLLMLGMDMDNLTYIYGFFRECRCPNLERLFVQLPVTSNVPLEDTVEVQVVLPEDVFVNLRMVKVMNFNWRCFEVHLVSHLLRKAAFLHKVLLVSPNVLPLHVPDVQEADLYLLKEALASGRIIVSEFDDPATQPFHSEVFLDV